MKIRINHKIVECVDYDIKHIHQAEKEIIDVNSITKYSYNLDILTVKFDNKDIFNILLTDNYLDIKTPFIQGKFLIKYDKVLDIYKKYKSGIYEIEFMHDVFYVKIKRMYDIYEKEIDKCIRKMRESKCGKL